MSKTAKQSRLALLLEQISNLPEQQTGLLAYKGIVEALNKIEDRVLGVDSWDPPRSFSEDLHEDRMYGTYPESMHPVPNHSYVTALIHYKHVIFISNNGAIEVYHERTSISLDQYKDIAAPIVKKRDFWGSGVWHLG